MAALFYFEDKVHLKQLQRAKKYPLFFPRMLGTILEYYGFPTEPDKEKKHHCREVILFPDGKSFLYPKHRPITSDGYVHISAEAFNQLLARLDMIQENQANIQLTQRQLVQRVDELTMAVQQWNSSSEKPTSVHDAHLCPSHLHKRQILQQGSPQCPPPF
ncbi:hypothetical protein CK203_032826 [Vitis vinifera]|uniref:Uncharacterized protein n=1 Tax=Vitis vinifera TaxID=29760 RepID=A0A438I8C2_VITVI|nr:hypothetical protein CK203_032826 [Vitis vinifera]